MSDPVHDQAHQTIDGSAARRDVVRIELAGRDAYEVLCLTCGQVRGTYGAENLPEPGVCWRCRSSDPRTYWTRDWQKERTP